MTVEVRLRSKDADSIIALATLLSQTLKVAHSEPKFSLEYGDYSIYFVVDVTGGEKKWLN